ncbi:ArsR/SmtB family transcription factor [Desulfoplanes formicivorans]|uniref:Transcriptional regulator n=1 Tax=Desulfoplanes formicivorans TaxID=1592317 RepID=A0A194AGC1_9BACT|nr:metalloregulator ArsR/SmtB family transcription factor [Desulfoplanes formicivorans]GAU08255.1 transcriptional regulator [Desulfoplanes formicivorans]
MDTVCQARCFHPASIARAQQNMPTPEQTRRIASLFATLGDPTRLGILLALRHGELCVCDLSSVMGMTVSAVSHQLRILRHQGLVASKKQGRMVMYRLDDEHVQSLLVQALEHGTHCSPTLSPETP